MPVRRPPALLCILAVLASLASAGCMGTTEESRGPFKVIEPVPYEREAPEAFGTGIGALVGEAWFGMPWDAANAADAMRAIGLRIERADDDLVVAHGGNGTRLIAAPDAPGGNGTQLTVVFEVGVPVPEDESLSEAAEREWVRVEDRFLEYADEFQETMGSPEAGDLRWSYVAYVAA